MFYRHRLIIRVPTDATSLLRLNGERGTGGVARSIEEWGNERIFAACENG